MRLVYVDTGAWLALLRPSDRDHPRIRAHFARLRTQGDVLLTTELVVAETATRLRYDAGLRRALAFRDALRRSVEDGGLRVHDGDEHLRFGAFEVMAQYADLRLSYADCVGAALARRESVEAIIGLDHDFLAMGFALEPGPG